MIKNLTNNIRKCFEHTAPHDKDKEVLAIIRELTHINKQMHNSNHASLTKFENCTGDITFEECYDQFILHTIEDSLSKCMIRTFAIFVLFKCNNPKGWEMTGAYYEDLVGKTINLNEFVFHTIRKATDIKYAAFPEDHIFELCARLIFLSEYLKINGDKCLDLRLKYQRVK